MKWFMNLSTQYKLLAGFCLMIVLLGTMIVEAYLGIMAVHESQNILYREEIPISVNTLKVRAHLNRERVVMQMLADATDRKVMDVWKQDIKENSDETNEILNKLRELGRNKPDYMVKIEKLITGRNTMNQLRDTQIIPLLYEDKRQEANKILEAEGERYEKLRDIAIDLSEMSEKNDQRIWMESNQSVRDTIRSFIILGAIALVVAVGVATFLTRIIAGPLKQVSDVAEQIAYGNLTVDVPSVNRTDEIGTLTITFGMMLEGLKMVTREVRETIDALTAATGDMYQSIETADTRDDETFTQPRVEAQNLKRLADRLKKLIEQYKV